MNMWWGNNGTTWQLFQNGTLIYSTSLTDNSPNPQTASSPAISNLALGTYSFTTKLTNSFGTTTGNTLSYTVTQGGTTNPTPPTTPKNLAATANSTSQITVTWSASSGATSYDLQVDGVVKTGVSSPFVHSGLAAGSTHTYAVRADNSAGDSAFSSSVSAKTQGVPTVPTVPTGLSATANSSSQITVTWNVSSGASSYDLLVDGTVKTGASSPYVSTGLLASSTHTYAVRADNSAGDSAFSTSVSAKTQSAPTVPAVPTGLSATANSSSQITVTWNASAGATSYDLQVDGVIKTGVSSPFVHSGLAASSAHTYAVRADNSAGDSAFSSLVSATTNSGTTPPVTTTGTISFHLLLGAGTAQDNLTLAGDNYTDLIMSNCIAGVMYGHLVEEYFPGIQFNKDYFYGSLMGQLLQEKPGHAILCVQQQPDRPVAQPAGGDGGRPGRTVSN